MRKIPHDDSLEGSLSLLREGYGFIRARCERLGSPVFRTRLLLQDTLCISGEAAARLFYDPERFERAHAAPRLLQRTLFGRGGVQSLDGAAHRQRKQLFLSLLDEAGVEELVARARDAWRAAMGHWQSGELVSLHQAVQDVLTRAVCGWAAVPLDEDEVSLRRDQLAAMIDGAGGIGARHWRARQARTAVEAWAGELIDQVRDGALTVAADRALAVVADHRDLDGQRLPSEVAAVELLNLLRPTVAVSRFIVYATLELHNHPDWRARLADDDRAVYPFAQEVRRLYAFFPFTVARVRQDFDWQGYRFAKGTRVMLDLFGTNREAGHWSDPDVFQPARFEAWDGNCFDFITQGGGEPRDGHRCPGEPLAVALLSEALRILTREMSYRLPEQDLTVDLSRMPAQPESDLLIEWLGPVLR